MSKKKIIYIVIRDYYGLVRSDYKFFSNIITSLAYISYADFLYQLLLSRYVIVQLKCYSSPPKYMSQYWTLRITMPCWSLEWFTDVTTGWDCCLLSSFGILRGASGTMKPNPQGEPFRLVSAHGSMDTLYEVQGVLSNRDLSLISRRKPRKIEIAYIFYFIFSWKDLVNNLKRNFHVWYWGFMRWS